jgi:hypothetical protein
LQQKLTREPAESRLQPGLAAPQSGKPQTVQAFLSDARRPINNRPDPEGTPTNLPHKIVTAREEGN